MATDIGPAVAEAPETRQRYRRLRALNVAVGVLLAAEALYMLLASNGRAPPTGVPSGSAPSSASCRGL